MNINSHLSTSKRTSIETQSTTVHNSLRSNSNSEKRMPFKQNAQNKNVINQQKRETQISSSSSNNLSNSSINSFKSSQHNQDSFENKIPKAPLSQKFEKLNFLEQKKQSLDHMIFKSSCFDQDQSSDFQMRKFSQNTDIQTEKSVTPVYSHYVPIKPSTSPFYFHNIQSKQDLNSNFSQFQSQAQIIKTSSTHSRNVSINSDTKNTQYEIENYMRGQAVQSASQDISHHSENNEEQNKLLASNQNKRSSFPLPLGSKSQNHLLSQSLNNNKSMLSYQYQLNQSGLNALQGESLSSIDNQNSKKVLGTNSSYEHNSFFMSQNSGLKENFPNIQEFQTKAQRLELIEDSSLKRQSLPLSQGINYNQSFPLLNLQDPSGGHQSFYSCSSAHLNQPFTNQAVMNSSFPAHLGCQNQIIVQTQQHQIQHQPSFHSTGSNQCYSQHSKTSVANGDSVISQSLPCQCTACLQAQMAYLQQLLIQQQQLYLQQTQQDQMLNESQSSQQSLQQRQNTNSFVRQSFNIEQQKKSVVSSQSETDNSSIPDEIEEAHSEQDSDYGRQQRLEQDQIELQRHYEQYMQQEIDLQASDQLLLNPQQNILRKTYIELPLGEIPEMKESFYEDQSRYTNSSISKQIHPQSQFGLHQSFSHLNSSRKSQNHPVQRLSFPYEENSSNSITHNNITSDIETPYHQRQESLQQQSFGAQAIDAQGSFVINQMAAQVQQPIVTPFKQRHYSGSNWGTSIPKQGTTPSISNHLPYTSTTHNKSLSFSNANMLQQTIEAFKPSSDNQTESSPFAQSQGNNFPTVGQFNHEDSNNIINQFFQKTELKNITHWKNSSMLIQELAPIIESYIEAKYHQRFQSDVPQFQFNQHFAKDINKYNELQNQQQLMTYPQPIQNKESQSLEDPLSNKAMLHSFFEYENQMKQNINNMQSFKNTEIQQVQTFQPVEESLRQQDYIDKNKLQKPEVIIYNDYSSSKDNTLLQSNVKQSSDQKRYTQFDSSLKSQRHESYEKDKTNKIINYILDKDPNLKNQSNSSNSRSRGIKIRYSVNPGSIEKSINKCRAMFNSVERQERSPQTQDLQIHKIVPFTVTTQHESSLNETYQQNYADMINQTIQTDEGAMKIRWADNEDSVEKVKINTINDPRSRSVEPKNGRKFQKYRSINNATHIVKKPIQTRNKTDSRATTKASLQKSSVNSKNGYLVKDQQKMRVQPLQNIKNNFTPNRFTNDKGLIQAQRNNQSNGVGTQRGQKSQKLQTRQPRQMMPKQQLIKPKTRVNNVFDRLASSDVKSRKTRVEMSLNKQLKGSEIQDQSENIQSFATKRLAISLKKPTRTQKFSQRLYEVNELPSLDHIQKTISVKRQKNQFVLNLNNRKSSLQSDQTTPGSNLKRTFIRPQINSDRKGSFNSSVKKDSLTRNKIANKSSLQKVDMVRKRTEMLQRTNRTDGSLTLERTPLQERDSSNIIINIRNNRTQHLRDEQQSASPAKYRQFKLQQQSTDIDNLRIATPMDVVVQEEYVVDQIVPSSEKTSIYKNPFQTSGLNSYRESYLIPQYKDSFNLHSKIASQDYRQQQIQNRNTSSIVDPYQQQQPKSRSTTPTRQNNQPILFNSVQPVQAFNIPVDNEYNLLSNQKLFKQQYMDQQRQVTQFDNDNQEDKRKELSRILNQLEAVERSRQSTMQQLSSFNTNDQKEFLSFNSNNNRSMFNDKSQGYQSKAQDSNINLIQTPMSKNDSQAFGNKQQSVCSGQDGNMKYISEVYTSPSIKKKNNPAGNNNFCLPNALFFKKDQQQANHFNSQRSSRDNEVLRQSTDFSPSMTSQTHRPSNINKNDSSVMIKSFGVDQSSLTSGYDEQMNNTSRQQPKSNLQKHQNAIPPRYSRNNKNENMMNSSKTQHSSFLLNSSHNKLNASQISNSSNREVLARNSYIEAQQQNQITNKKQMQNNDNNAQFRTLKLSQDEKEILKERVQQHRNSLNRSHNIYN